MEKQKMQLIISFIRADTDIYSRVIFIIMRKKSCISNFFFSWFSSFFSLFFLRWFYICLVFSYFALLNICFSKIFDYFKSFSTFEITFNMYLTTYSTKLQFQYWIITFDLTKCLFLDQAKILSNRNNLVELDKLLKLIHTNFKNFTHKIITLFLYNNVVYMHSSNYKHNSLSLAFKSHIYKMLF